jgi:hypothetical protein
LRALQGAFDFKHPLDFMKAFGRRKLAGQGAGWAGGRRALMGETRLSAGVGAPQSPLARCWGLLPPPTACLVASLARGMCALSTACAPSVREAWPACGRGRHAHSQPGCRPPTRGRQALSGC